MKKLKMVTNVLNKKSFIKKELYGQFVEQVGRIIYDGLFVGEDSPIPNKNGVRTDIIEAFKEIKVPLLHWPGGGVADWYYWKEGIGKENERKPLINRWSNGLEDNSFGTHEFFDLCEEIGCEPYLVLNAGSAQIRDNMQWLEYITYDGDTEMTRLRKKNGRKEPWNLIYACLGNEWWMFDTVEQYAQQYKQFNNFTKNLGKRCICRILRGGHHTDFGMTDALISNVPEGTFHCMTLYHVIYAPGGFQNAPNTDFSVDDYYYTIRSAIAIDADIDRHIGIVRKKDGNQNVKLAIDEWGTWYKTPWDNEDPNGFWSMTTTMRDAIAAAEVLNIYNKHSDVLEMASLCMSVNALHAILLTKGEQLLKTPTYYVMKMFMQHQDATLIDSYIEQSVTEFNDGTVPTVSQSVSVKDGKMHMTFVNCSVDEEFEIENTILFGNYSKATGEIIQNEIHDTNTFDNPNTVISKEYSGLEFIPEGIRIILPPTSIVSVTLQ